MSVSRRSLLRTALGLAAVPGLSACALSGGGSGDGGVRGTVTPENPLGVEGSAPLAVAIFGGALGDEYARFAQSIYQQRNPQAQIDVRVVQRVQDELQPQFVAGDPPDVVHNSGARQITAGTLVGDDQLADLADLYAATAFGDPARKVGDTLRPGALEPGTFDGRVLAANYTYSVFGIWYSEPLFRQHGWQWPSTWDDFLALCDEIQRTGMSPMAYGGQNAADYMLETLLAMAIKQGGFDVARNIDNLRPGAWTAEPVRNAADAIYQLGRRGYFMPGSEGLQHTEGQAAWVQGRAAMYSAANYVENEMKGITPPGFDMVMGAVPSLSTSDAMPSAALHAAAGEPFIVPSQAHNGQGGKEFLRIMLSKQAATKCTELTGMLTVVRDAVPGGDFGTKGFRSVGSALAAAGDNTFTWLYRDWYPAVRTAAYTEIGNLLAGRTDPRAFTATIQTASDAVARDANVKKFQR